MDTWKTTWTIAGQISFINIDSFRNRKKTQGRGIYSLQVNNDIFTNVSILGDQNISVTPFTDNNFTYNKWVYNIEEDMEIDINFAVRKTNTTNEDICVKFKANLNKTCHVFKNSSNTGRLLRKYCVEYSTGIVHVTDSSSYIKYPPMYVKPTESA